MGACIEIGNLVKDPERFGQNEKSPYKTAIALNDRCRAVDGTRKAMFLDLVIFPGTPAFTTIEKLAAAGYPLGKGSLVEVNGSLQEEEYEKDGQVRKSRFLKVVAIELPKVGRKSESGDSTKSEAAPAGGRSQAAPAAAPAASDTPGDVDFDL